MKVLPWVVMKVADASKNLQEWKSLQNPCRSRFRAGGNPGRDRRRGRCERSDRQSRPQRQARRLSEAARQSVLVALDLLGYERPTRLRRRSSGPGRAGGARSWRTRSSRRSPQVIDDALSSAPLHAGAVHPVARRHLRGRVRRVAARPRRRRHHLRLRSVTRTGRRRPRALPRTDRPWAAGGVRQRPRRGARRTVPLHRRARGDDARGLAPRRLGHTRIGLAIGPRRYVPALRKREGFVGRAGAQLCASRRGRRALDRGGALHPRGRSAAATRKLLERGRHRRHLRFRPDGARRHTRRARDLPGKAPDVSVVGFDDSPLISVLRPASDHRAPAGPLSLPFFSLLSLLLYLFPSLPLPLFPLPSLSLLPLHHLPLPHPFRSPSPFVQFFLPAYFSSPHPFPLLTPPPQPPPTLRTVWPNSPHGQAQLNRSGCRWPRR